MLNATDSLTHSLAVLLLILLVGVNDMPTSS